ncbi:hypothetical protein BU23DRAFT_643887 [Bimuria novae-zelandiae CBS 107.79]|uniref:Uncharacterized protein n=1 Tax=Bimuria novae-zelandiae CBS 107.79 TaxID=1447943 RepID=A0A6A5V5Z3_9PLEO|nr:hypothetical protein BU23DRAFT_643887 [Bimuria novae-zelandiae CBS 107.79]
MNTTYSKIRNTSVQATQVMSHIQPHSPTTGIKRERSPSIPRNDSFISLNTEYPSSSQSQANSQEESLRKYMQQDDGNRSQAVPVEHVNLTFRHSGDAPIKSEPNDAPQLIDREPSASASTVKTEPDTGGEPVKQDDAPSSSAMLEESEPSEHEGDIKTKKKEAQFVEPGSDYIFGFGKFEGEIFLLGALKKTYTACLSLTILQTSLSSTTYPSRNIAIIRTREILLKVWSTISNDII